MNKLGSYSLSPEKKYWYNTDVNSVQWRYPTASAGIWGESIPSPDWFVPIKPMPAELGDWKPETQITVPFPTVLEKLETPINIEDIKKRLREEIFLEVREYVDRIVPIIVLMLQDRWISILGKEKKYTDGYFCFCCGAPIPRGTEKELCKYCGN